MNNPKPPERDTATFDEPEYLRRYPDVVAAIAEGKYRSGLEHFERYGRAEGRTYVARPTGKSQVVFGPVGGFAAAQPGAPRHAIDGVLIAEEGWIFAVGWAYDMQEVLLALSIDGRDWGARVEAVTLARVQRSDVQKALGLTDAVPLGFLLLIRAGARLNPVVETRVTFEWRTGKSTLTAPARPVGLQEMLDEVLGVLTRVAGSPAAAMLAMQDGFGEQVAALNRAVTSGLVRNPLVQRFADTPKAAQTSIVVCLYGRPEYLFTQNALFANRPGIEDCEFIYVCNSPELLERLLKEAACGTSIYGLRQTVVGLPGNAGFGAANNLGVQLARGGRVVCLNPDVFPRDPNWAVRHSAIVEAGGDGSRLFGALLFYDDGTLMHGGMYFELDTMLAIRSGRIQSAAFARVEHYGKGAPPDTAAFLRTRPVPAVSGAFVSIERSWYEHLGGFAEDYVLGHYEDADLCLRSLQAGVPAWVQDVRMWHLEGQGSRRSPVLAGTSLINRALFSQRWRALIADRLHGPDARPDAPRPELAGVAAE